MISFGPDEQPRNNSCTVRTRDLGKAVHPVRRDASTHIDASTWIARPPGRNEWRRHPPRTAPSIVRAAVKTPARMLFRHHQVPDGTLRDWLMRVRTGQICYRERSVDRAARPHGQQHYSVSAWKPSRTQTSCRLDPVLGSDIWEAHDAVRMMDETGTDGVVISRGCLGRNDSATWSTRCQVARPASHTLGAVCEVGRAPRLFRCHMGEEPRHARLPQNTPTGT
jgi:hypothetical protein